MTNKSKSYTCADCSYCVFWKKYYLCTLDEGSVLPGFKACNSFVLKDGADNE